MSHSLVRVGWPAVILPGLTGPVNFSISFSFDTSGLSGGFSTSDGGAGIFVQAAGDLIGAASSGPPFSQFLFGSISLSNGAVTGWSFDGGELLP